MTRNESSTLLWIFGAAVAVLALVAAIIGGSGSDEAGAIASTAPTIDLR